MVWDGNRSGRHERLACNHLERGSLVLIQGVTKSVVLDVQGLTSSKHETRGTLAGFVHA
jgi:hypothetical protein